MQFCISFPICSSCCSGVRWRHWFVRPHPPSRTIWCGCTCVRWTRWWLRVSRRSTGRSWTRRGVPPWLRLRPPVMTVLSASTNSTPRTSSCSRGYAHVLQKRTSSSQWRRCTGSVGEMRIIGFKIVLNLFKFIK